MQPCGQAVPSAANRRDPRVRTPRTPTLARLTRRASWAANVRIELQIPRRCRDPINAQPLPWTVFYAATLNVRDARWIDMTIIGAVGTIASYAKGFIDAAKLAQQVRS